MWQGKRIGRRRANVLERQYNFSFNGKNMLGAIQGIIIEGMLREYWNIEAIECEVQRGCFRLKIIRWIMDDI